MVSKKVNARLKPTVEDNIRAIGYAALGVWAVVYFFFPPVSSIAALDWVLRGTWMFFTFVGAAMAFAGSVLRIDIKLELPGLLVGLLGPAIYAVTQLYFVVVFDPAFGPPSQRYALLTFALLPVLFAMPRVVALLMEARRLKSINRNSVESAQALLDAIAATTGPTETRGKK